MHLRIHITGKSPLLYNKMTDEAADAATAGARNASANQERLSPEDDARSRLHTDDQDNVTMPAQNIMAALRYAGRFKKVGGKFLSTRDRSQIPGALTFDQIAYPLLSESSWHVFKNIVTIPATGGKIWRYRPCFYDWELHFETQLETDYFSEQILYDVFKIAGDMAGLGDFRPSKGGGTFGKFNITHWEVLKEPPQPKNAAPAKPKRRASRTKD